MLFVKGLVMGGVICLCLNCSAGERSAASSEKNGMDSGDPVVLAVQEKMYTSRDFDSYVNTIAGETAPELGADARSRLFDQFIEEKILLADAHSRSLVLTQAEKRHFLAKLKQRYEGGDEPGPWENADTASLFDRLLLEKLTVELVKDIAVTEEEIQAYYERNKRDFLRPELVTVSQILLETEDKAVEVRESLKNADEAAFRKTAAAVSQGMEAERGGEMGTFQLGQLPAEMEQVVFALKPGEISQVLESAYGFHIFRLDAKSEAELIAWEEAAVEIEVKIRDRKISDFMRDHVRSLKSKWDWSSNPQNLAFAYQRDHDV
jgi:parvulin-like peptidyl-prolyl isomerase